MNSKNCYRPLPFQQCAIERVLRNPSHGLFLSPGAGKTAIMLSALTELRRQGRIQASLVVAPQRPLRKTWRQEAEKWGFPLTFSLVHGTPAQRKRALAAAADVYLINPENIAWLSAQEPETLPPFDALVVDESQKFKNVTTQRAKALKAMLPRFRRRYCLSGTPAAESLMDLFGQVRILDNGKRLGYTLTEFRSRYCWPETAWAGYTIWHLKDGAADEIQRSIADICYRLDAADYIQMPERVDTVIHVESEAAVEACKLIREGRYPGLVSKNAAAVVNSLKQATGGALYLGDEGTEKRVQEIHDDKLQALADLVEEQQGEPILVAVAYRHEIPRIAGRLKKVIGREPPHIAGGISHARSDELVDAWNSGKLPVLIVHPGSVSTGLNLQSGGRAIVWYGLPWSLDEYIQTNARVYRQGQSRTVFIHHLIVEGTVDEVVLDVLQTKNATQEDMYHALEAYIAQASS